MNQLSLRPLQGGPLKPCTVYAAVVMRELKDATGNLPGVPLSFREALAGQSAGLPESYAETVVAFSEEVVLDEVAGLAVFTTGARTETMSEFADAIRKLPTPLPQSAATLIDVYDDYSLYQTTVEMPVYQQRAPPFSQSGGEWPTVAVVQGQETARVVSIVPPYTGFPTVVMIRTGGGGDRPFIDRGVRDVTGEAIPGTGPAMYLAREGVAGVSVDGPQDGLRNISGQDEQFLLFNLLNPGALRDNVRQSAPELLLVPDILQDLSIDASDCPGNGDGAVGFDSDKLWLLGHSMGASITPLVLANSDAFDLGILSGAGSSYLMNVVHKQSLLTVRPLAEAMNGYADPGLELTPHDPLLSWIQWAGEPADSTPCADAYAGHLLVYQGVVDTYILPPVADPTNLSFGLDLAGVARDTAVPQLEAYRSLLNELPFVGRGQVRFPVSENSGPNKTRAVVQLKGDGHEVFFQGSEAQIQLRCVLRTWLEAAPVVVGPILGCE